MAVKWFHAAAERGDAGGQYVLGLIGQAEEKSDEAARWFGRAGSQGLEERKRDLIVRFTSYAGTGSCNLRVSSSPPEAFFYAFSGEGELLFSGMTPFEAKNLPEGTAEICIKKEGVGRAWSTGIGLTISGSYKQYEYSVYETLSSIESRYSCRAQGRMESHRKQLDHEDAAKEAELNQDSCRGGYYSSLLGQCISPLLKLHRQRPRHRHATVIHAALRPSLPVQSIRTPVSSIRTGGG